MPLSKGKSKQAFKHNVEVEMNAGKPRAQSLAIAYATKRRAQNKYNGGMVEPEQEDSNEMFLSENMESPWQEQSADDDLFLSDDGNQDAEPAVENDPHAERLKRIMSKRR